MIFNNWWDKLEYFLNFTTPIYGMIQSTNRDTPYLHLIYDMWDTMIEEVRSIIFKHEDEDLLASHSSFFDAIQKVLETR